MYSLRHVYASERMSCVMFEEVEVEGMGDEGEASSSSSSGSRDVDVGRGWMDEGGG